VTLSLPKAGRLLIAGLLMAAAAVAIILAESGHSSAAGPATPVSQVLSQFSVFDGASSAADALPADAGPEPAAAPLTRSIATGSADLSQWATLNGNQGCVVIEGTAPGAQGTPASCTDLESATAANELLTIAAASSTQPYARKLPETIVAGLAPNGVNSVSITLANGASHTVPVVDNGFHLLTGGSDPVAYEWASADGAKHVQNLKGS
jgi:hypothetical protein